MQLQNATNLFSSHRSVCCRSLRTQVDFSWFFLSAMFSSHSLIWRRTAVCSYFSTRLSRTMCIDFLVCKRQITTARSKKNRKRLVHPRESVRACCARVRVWVSVLRRWENFHHFPYLRRAHCGIGNDAEWAAIVWYRQVKTSESNDTYTHIRTECGEFAKMVHTRVQTIHRPSQSSIIFRTFNTHIFPYRRAFT